MCVYPPPTAFPAVLFRRLSLAAVAAQGGTSPLRYRANWPSAGTAPNREKLRVQHRYLFRDNGGIWACSARRLPAMHFQLAKTAGGMWSTFAPEARASARLAYLVVSAVIPRSFNLAAQYSGVAFNAFVPSALHKLNLTWVHC